MAVMVLAFEDVPSGSGEERAKCGDEARYVSKVHVLAGPVEVEPFEVYFAGGVLFSLFI